MHLFALGITLIVVARGRLDFIEWVAEAMLLGLPIPIVHNSISPPRCPGDVFCDRIWTTFGAMLSLILTSAGGVPPQWHLGIATWPMVAMLMLVSGFVLFRSIVPPQRAYAIVTSDGRDAEAPTLPPSPSATTTEVVNLGTRE